MDSNQFHINRWSFPVNKRHSRFPTNTPQGTFKASDDNIVHSFNKNEYCQYFYTLIMLLNMNLLLHENEFMMPRTESTAGLQIENTPS